MITWDDSKDRRQNLEDEATQKKASKLIVRGDEVALKENPRRGNRSLMIISPGKGFHIQTMDCRMSELPPGVSTNIHRHRSQAIIHILVGSGYSVVNDQKITWKAGDTLFIPSWFYHNFCNSDPEKPARYLAVTNGPLVFGLGLEEEEKKE
jgi:gentisate 1,2-dioxygenase